MMGISSTIRCAGAPRPTASANIHNDLDHLSMFRVRCLEIKYAVAANSTFFPLSHCLAYIVRPNFVIQEQPFQLKVRGNEKKTIARQDPMIQGRATKDDC
jgi:hypothetical protein